MNAPRKFGIGAVFAVVLGLFVLMILAMNAPAITRKLFGSSVVQVPLVAGQQDAEGGQFALCHGPIRDTCVVDGDTIWYHQQKIRIADINAPEISHPQCDDELDLGEKATDRLLILLNQGKFSLEPLPDRDTDKYGRLLRTITRGGHSLGEVLVGEGLAERWVGYRRDWCH
jgi:endonuclease YncB( thermonuclease family)